MKAATIFHLALGLFIVAFFSPAPQSLAQDGDAPEASEKFSREELTQMLAPIALYPDALLSQVLMASTYPIEVVEADRWVKKNSHLTGDPLDTALLDQDWDPSVKAMCHFPSILALMSERISETTNLGNAFLAQEAEVMNVVQELRSKAYAQGNLTTNSQQKVVVEKETIIIEPVDPRIYYVPYYDPLYIYGPWWYPAFPPFFWGPPGVSIGIGISYWPAFYFGFPLLTWSYFDWHHHHVFIVVHQRPRYVRHDRWLRTPGRWHHLPRHRRGVAYRDKFTARKYGQYPRRTRDYRRDTRGFPERPDRDRTRRGTERPGVVREPSGDSRTRTERQAPERIERERERARTEQERGERVERERTERERAGTDRRIERQQPQQGVQRGKDVRIQRPPERGRDNIFNRVEEGRQERKSSERGRSSRERRGGDSRGQGQSGRGGPGLRYDRGPARR